MRFAAAATTCALLVAQLSSVEAAKFTVIYNCKGGRDGASSGPHKIGAAPTKRAGAISSSD